MSLSEPEFDFEINRVETCFTSKGYPEEKLKMIWRFTRHLSRAQLTKIVDHFISTSKFAPTPNDFRDAATLESRKFFEQDQVETPWPDSIFDKEETTLFFKTLRGVLDGSISKDQKDQMIEYIETRLKGAGIKT